MFYLRVKFQGLSIPRVYTFETWAEAEKAETEQAKNIDVVRTDIIKGDPDYEFIK